MPYMVPEYERGVFYLIDDGSESHIVPADYAIDAIKDAISALEADTSIEVRRLVGVGARLTAPGYTDATD